LEQFGSFKVAQKEMMVKRTRWTLDHKLSLRDNIANAVSALRRSSNGQLTSKELEAWIAPNIGLPHGPIRLDDGLSVTVVEHQMPSNQISIGPP